MLKLKGGIILVLLALFVGCHRKNVQKIVLHTNKADVVVTPSVAEAVVSPGTLLEWRLEGDDSYFEIHFTEGSPCDKSVIRSDIHKVARCEVDGSVRGQSGRKYPYHLWTSISPDGPFVVKPPPDCNSCFCKAK